MAKRQLTRDATGARFEYRVWGAQRQARKLLAELADEQLFERVDDCYLLVDDSSWNAKWNAKIRDNTLKIKQLVAERKGFEQWTSDRHHSADTVPTPFDLIFEQLGLDRPQRGGAMTLLRTVGLSERDGETHLTQLPTASLDDQRSDHRRYEGPSVEAIADAVAGDPGGDVLDRAVDIVLGEAERVGVHVAVGDRSAVRIRYDVGAGQLSVDRTQSGAVTFAPGFAAVHDAPLLPIDGRISLRIVLDRSSVEVFADEGRVVLTDLVFPAADATRVALMSEGGPTGPASLDLWNL